MGIYLAQPGGTMRWAPIFIFVATILSGERAPVLAAQDPEPSIETPAAQEKPALSLEELSVRRKNPTTMTELLDSLKVVQEHALLLREDFYTDEMLIRFLGQGAVSWRGNTVTYKSAQLNPVFKDSRAIVQVYRFLEDADKKPSLDGQVRANITVLLCQTADCIPLEKDAGLRLKQVEGVFGSAKKDTRTRGIQKKRAPSDDASGNTIVYEAGTLGTKRNAVLLRFDRNGILDAISLNTDK